MKKLSMPNKGTTWRVIFPAGSVIDFPDSEPVQWGPILTFVREGKVIATFQSWAGYHVVEVGK